MHIMVLYLSQNHFVDYFKQSSTDQDLTHPVLASSSFSSSSWVQVQTAAVMHTFIKHLLLQLLKSDAHCGSCYHPFMDHLLGRLGLDALLAYLVLEPCQLY